MGHSIYNCSSLHTLGIAAVLVTGAIGGAGCVSPVAGGRLAQKTATGSASASAGLFTMARGTAAFGSGTRVEGAPPCDDDPETQDIPDCTDDPPPPPAPGGETPPDDTSGVCSNRLTSVNQGLNFNTAAKVDFEITRILNGGSDPAASLVIPGTLSMPGEPVPSPLLAASASAAVRNLNLPALRRAIAGGDLVEYFRPMVAANAPGLAPGYYYISLVGRLPGQSAPVGSAGLKRGDLIVPLTGVTEYSQAAPVVHVTATGYRLVLSPITMGGVFVPNSTRARQVPLLWAASGARGPGAAQACAQYSDVEPQDGIDDNTGEAIPAHCLCDEWRSPLIVDRAHPLAGGGASIQFTRSSLVGMDLGAKLDDGAPAISYVTPVQDCDGDRWITLPRPASVASATALPSTWISQAKPANFNSHSVNGIHEMFGDGTRVRAGANATTATGFEALAVYDVNGPGGRPDGWITAADPVFKHLALWCDANRSGLYKPGTGESPELISLQDDGFTGLPVRAIDVSEYDDFRNHTRQRGEAYKLFSGVPQPMLLIDVWMHVFGSDPRP